MPPFRTVHLDHVVLRVKDLEASKTFYQDVIGASFERELPEFGLYQLRIGAALIDLVPINSPMGQQGGGPLAPEGKNLDHFAIRIDPFDLDELKQHLAAFNIEPSEVGIRYGAEGNGPSIYIPDPDGNLVELKGPPRDTV